MGDPLINYEGKSNPYIDYQSIDLLLSLQHPRSEGYDEMCFYVMGQVKEILFKGLHFELFNAREQIKLDEINTAIDYLINNISVTGEVLTIDSGQSLGWANSKSKVFSTD